MCYTERPQSLTSIWKHSNSCVLNVGTLILSAYHRERTKLNTRICSFCNPESGVASVFWAEKQLSKIKMENQIVNANLVSSSSRNIAFVLKSAYFSNLLVRMESRTAKMTWSFNDGKDALIDVHRRKMQNRRFIGFAVVSSCFALHTNHSICYVFLFLQSGFLHVGVCCLCGKHCCHSPNLGEYVPG